MSCFHWWMFNKDAIASTSFEFLPSSTNLLVWTINYKVDKFMRAFCNNRLGINWLFYSLFQNEKVLNGDELNQALTQLSFVIYIVSKHKKLQWKIWYEHVNVKGFFFCYMCKLVDLLMIKVLFFEPNLNCYDHEKVVWFSGSNLFRHLFPST